MDKIFVRNFLLFFFILSLCLGGLFSVLITGEQDLRNSGNWLLHTHQVIIESQEVSRLVEGALADQRGYLLSRNDEFLTQYENKKNAIKEQIATLIVMTSNNPSQTSRLKNFSTIFQEFVIQLDKKIQMPLVNWTTEDIKRVTDLKRSLLDINNDLAQEEYRILDRHFKMLHIKKDQYFLTVLVGGAVSAVMLLLLNGFLLQAHSRRTKAERTLRDTEERLILATEGTNDGIYDWNIRDNTVFYSRPFFSMLGYNRPAFTGTLDDFKGLIHKEDRKKVWEVMDEYLHGKSTEFSHIYRARHISGRWIWLHSRAKAVFDQDGKPIRLVGAHTDITYIKEYEEKLHKEKRAAESANKAKGEFLAHMSHEIRTPLTAISGIAEIFAQNNDNLSEKQAKLVRTLHSSTSSLKDLINDVLDFSKIESGELELEHRPFPIADLFEPVISIMSVKATEKKLEFTADYAALAETIFYGDRARIRQILINLTSNAIKFTDSGAVKLVATITQTPAPHLVIDVVDTGIGIPEENHELIFERFKQADSSVSRKYGGTGLGLAISLRLAQLMGGTIKVHSQPGSGSTFKVILPFAEAEAQTQEKQDKAVPRTVVTHSSTRDKRLLLAEDYEGNIIVLSYILDEIGCLYDVARTGKEALDMWRDNHYDLILMDIQMPEMDGFTATEHIRGIESENNLTPTPIIAMTAHALVADKDRCIAAGMDAYISKPIMENELKTLIYKYLDVS